MSTYALIFGDSCHHLVDISSGILLDSVPHQPFYLTNLDHWCMVNIGDYEYQIVSRGNGQYILVRTGYSYSHFMGRHNKFTIK